MTKMAAHDATLFPQDFQKEVVQIGDALRSLM